MTIGREFGQQEPLTRRLHNLVRSYPKGLGVLKEFIQNADDAEADEIVFFIDEQQHDIAGLPQGMKWLHQKPALLVYNNKPFTDSDIKGIQNIGESGKSDSVGKTGRFGLGFNACYNVTDVPSFFTKNELYFFDPHYQTVPGASVDSPGRCFGVDELIDEGWPLLDSFFRFIGNGDGFTGTVFRLPFRTSEQARTSLIKHDAYTIADALDAVRELQEKGSVILLFLKHVRRLKVERRTQNGTVITLLSMQSTNPQEIASSRSKVNDLLSSHDPERILTYLTEEGDVFSSCLHDYSVEVNGVKHTETWRVVDGFFTDADNEAIDVCRKMIENEEKALPYAGAAWLLNSDQHPEGCLFCFLPLPMHTSLPIQINGYFDLDDSRQNMFLDQSTRGSARLRVKWNRTLLEISVSQAYVRLLEDLRSDLGTNSTDSYYDAFPEVVDSETSWEGWLTSAFYEYAALAPLFKCSGDSTWCVLSATRSLPVDLISVGDELIAEGFLPILSPALPSHIEKGFSVNSINAPVLTPCDLRVQLKEHRDLDCAVAAAPRACLRKRDYIIKIFSFCLRDDPEDGLRGLPLVIDCRGHLRTVGLTENPLYISETSWDMDVFWDRPEWFVDPDFAQEVKLPAMEHSSLLNMDSENFVRELAGYVSAQTRDGGLKLNRARVGALTDVWLRAVFSRLLESNLDKLESDLNNIPLIPDQSKALQVMGSPSTPLLFRGPSELKRALTDLSVPLVFSDVSEKLLALLGQFSEKENCIWPVTPRDLVDTLDDVCRKVLQEYETLTDVQRALLNYLSKEDSLVALKKPQLLDRIDKLRTLRIFPTAKGGLVSLSETAYVSQDFKFPAVDFDVVLLNDGPLHRWRELYLLLGARELSRSRLIREVLLPGFGALDESERVKASAWLRDNLSVAQSEDTDGDSNSLFDKVRTTPIIICEDGVLRAPTEVYQPESGLASAVLRDQAVFPDMEGAYSVGRERWLEFYRQLDMPTEPLLVDVVNYVRLLVTDDSGGENVQRLQAVYDFIKNCVDVEIQKLNDVSDELATVLGELAEIPWLPLRQEPGEFLCFRRPAETYARPCDVYFPRVGQLVASQACITVLRPEPNRRTRKAMGFPVRTPVELVVEHFQEILGVFSTSERIPKETVLVRVLGQIYRFLGGEAPREAEEHDHDAEGLETEGTVDLKSIFCEVPCIWDQERGCFWRPDQVFKDNVRYMEPWRRTIRSSEDAIERGYAALGRKQEPTVDDWKQVLMEIAACHRSPTEFEISGVILEVLRYIVKELANVDEIDGEVLVPTSDGRMLEAETVFLADAPWYESMLDSWDIPILASFVSGLLGIQRVLSIHSLAASVEQRLTEYPAESKLEKECQECARLENVLRSREFILGLQRLMRHEEHEVSEESLSYLCDVHVRCVKAIRTCLYLQTDGIERLLGDADADIYWEHEDLQAMLVENRRRYFCDDLAGLLNRALQDNCLQNLAPLVHVLQSEPTEISEVLNDLKIRHYMFDREAKLEDEDEVAPQVFPSEFDEGDEWQETVESEKVEFHTPGDNKHSEDPEGEKVSTTATEGSAVTSLASRNSGGLTATKPRRDETGQLGQRSKAGRPGGGGGSSVSTGTSITGSGTHGDRSDMERGQPPAGKASLSGKSTASRSPSTAQRRLISYVSQGGEDITEKDESTRADSRRLHVGDTAVEIVIEHEQKKGRKARSMAHLNAGYDIISEGEGETRYIEVKGTEAAWGERGVAMTPTQFFYARENSDRDHWLYVVEDVFSQSPRIHKIQNPSEKVDRFVFDGGWRQAAESDQVAGVKMSIPSSGDQVIENNQIVGVVESTLASGRFPLVIYKDLADKQHRKLLADLIIRKKES
jgi:sacsin